MSWDRDLLFVFGQAMAVEEKAKGANILLGPGVNLARIPWSGRLFEYLGGEDPFCSAELVSAELAGIQSVNVSAVVKHFALNSIEANRTTVASSCSWRAFMEQYAAPFAAAVRSGVSSVMCSYNRIQLGSSPTAYACENPQTLGWLYNEAGFEGWVQSDWGATHSTMQAALAGLTQQMPDDSFYGASLKEAVANGSIPLSLIDTMALRVLYPLYAVGLVDDPINPRVQNLTANVTSAAHNLLARQLAEQSTVLLKNEGALLPLDTATFKSVLVLGDASTIAGRGSGGVRPPYIVSPWQGLASYLNNGGNPVPARPANCSYIADQDYAQPVISSCVSAASLDDCCVKCTERADCFAFTFIENMTCAEPPLSPGNGPARTPLGSSSGLNLQCWLHPSADNPIRAPGKVAGVCAPQPVPSGPFNVVYNNTQDASVAAALAEQFDVVVMNVAVDSGEGHDRMNLSLPVWQDQMVAAVASVNKRVVVVARCAGACEMPWVDDVPAIVYQMLPGQECGNALARILLGIEAPSGKLALSFPKSMNQTWITSPQQYPGVAVNGTDYPVSVYSEGLFWGYRYYDANDIAPLFPFGHGLSYSSFKYGSLAVEGQISASNNASAANVTFLLQNVAGPAGAEVPQLYLGFPEEADEPPKLLRGFTKVWLQPSTGQRVTFKLDATSVRIWDESASQWRVVPGTYQVYVGSSSRDIRLTGQLVVAP